MVAKKRRLQLAANRLQKALQDSVRGLDPLMEAGLWHLMGWHLTATAA